MRSGAIPLLALVIALVGAAPAASASVTVARDEADRIVRLEIDTGGFGQTGRKSGGSYTIEASPGEDVRGGAARIFWEMPVTGGLGNGVLRAEGVPIATAVPLERDAITGAAIAPTPRGPAPSAEAFAALSVPSRNELAFALIACSSIGFGDSAIDAMCGALWLLATHGDDLPIEPAVASSAYRDVPAEWSEREQALLGCGAAYGTSCDEDGIDLRLADAGTLHQWFPGFATVLPDAGDSDVVQRVAWNWYAAQLMRRGVEPGVGYAADCTFETPGGCADLVVAGPRFPARRVLPDEPTAGPEVRWDWEVGTTFELGPVEVEGDVSPPRLALFLAAGLQHVHVTGPFAGANGEPDAAVYWVPEPTGPLALPTAAAVLLAIRRRRSR
jgi:hypothetical protein